MSVVNFACTGHNKILSHGDTKETSREVAKGRNIIMKICDSNYENEKNI